MLERFGPPRDGRGFLLEIGEGPSATHRVLPFQFMEEQP